MHPTPGTNSDYIRLWSMTSIVATNSSLYTVVWGEGPRLSQCNLNNILENGCSCMGPNGDVYYFAVNRQNLDMITANINTPHPGIFKSFGNNIGQPKRAVVLRYVISLFYSSASVLKVSLVCLMLQLPKFEYTCLASTRQSKKSASTLATKRLITFATSHHQ
jgi:hypothetical protein